MSIDRTVPHTVWFWDDRGADVAPYPCSAQFDNADEAEEAARKMIDAAPPWLAWVRVFRTGNENYQTLTWDRDKSREATPVPSHHQAVGALRRLGFDADHEEKGEWRLIDGCVCPDCVAALVIDAACPPLVEEILRLDKETDRLRVIIYQLGGDADPTKETS